MFSIEICPLLNWCSLQIAQYINSDNIVDYNTNIHLTEGDLMEVLLYLLHFIYSCLFTHQGSSRATIPFYGENCIGGYSLVEELGSSQKSCQCEQIDNRIILCEQDQDSIIIKVNADCP